MAFVTGAASGIGAATASALSDAGQIVVIGDLDLDGARATATELVAAGGEALAVHIDVGDPSSCKRAISEIDSRFGRLDTLVCNAGVGGPARLVVDVSIEEWEHIVNVNLGGVFHTCRVAVPLIQRGHRGGRIVTVSSIAGKEGNPSLAAYSASKAGVIAFTKSLAKELVDDEILVNVVAPALIETPLTDIHPDVKARLISKIPMGRLGHADEVANLIEWLCSDKCTFSTGAVYDISGGRATY